MVGSLWRMGSGLAVFGTLLFSFAGCGDDNGTDTIFTCENCEHWTKVIGVSTTYPAYRPGGIDVIAFSSDRGNMENNEDIWVAEVAEPNGDREVTTYYQITSSADDDFDPSWSPDGERIAFTRAIGNGYELYLIRVDDFSNPGDDIRLTNTDVSDTTIIARPSSSCWLDEETILFSNGQDIYTVSLDGDAPTSVNKIINDPSDFIFSGIDDFVENQPTGIRQGGVDRIFFVSDSREPLGAIQVEALDVEGEIVNAEVHLEGVPTGVFTPTVVSGRPALDELGRPGEEYLVGAAVTDEDAEEDYCDTLLTRTIQVFENDTSEVEFTFDNPRGVIRLLAEPLNSNFFFDGVQQVSIREDTTWIECVFPNIVDPDNPDSVVQEVLHEVKIVSIVARDTAGNLLRDSSWVSLMPQETLQVELDVSGQSEGGKKGWGGSYRMRPAGGGKMAASYSPQQEDAILWLYDGSTGDYVPFSSEGEFPSFPAVDPSGQHLVYVVDFKRLKLVDLVSFQEWWIPIPGAVGINICYREVAYPSWSEDGTKLLVSLTPCLDRPSSDNNAPEYEIWEFDFQAWAP